MKITLTADISDKIDPDELTALINELIHLNEFPHDLYANYEGIIDQLENSEVFEFKREKATPPRLKKPYEYQATRPEFEATYKALRTYLSPLDPGELQCTLVDRKGITYGMRFNVFILAYDVGLCGDGTGVTKDRWDSVVKKVEGMLTKLLGPNAKMYVEPWSSSGKFQARFETYVMLT